MNRGWKTVIVEDALQKQGIAGKTMLMSGNHAVVWGALVAGCRFFAGYPITPSSKILFEMAKELKSYDDGIFYQPEDELASIGMVISASVCGKKSMTATSGPGLSLMQEELGWAIINEIPLVIINVMRVGPSTGQPTKPGSADINCMIHGRHGDGGEGVIVLSPASVQECFEMTIAAFNLSEEFRVPVFVAIDGYLGGLSEKVNIPGKVMVFDRIVNLGESSFGGDGNVSGFSAVGEDRGIVYTGLIHDASGKRTSYNPESCRKNIAHILKKQKNIAAGARTEPENYEILKPDIAEEDCDYFIVSYGLTGRTAKEVSLRMNKAGIRTGVLNLKMIWPLDPVVFVQLSHAKKIIVAENNTGQLYGFLRAYLGTEKLSVFVNWDGCGIDADALYKFCLREIMQRDEISLYGLAEKISGADIVDVSTNLKKQRVVRVKKEYPFCPGCGHKNFSNIFLSAFSEKGLNSGNTIFISGIGCASILPSTFDADVIKVSHGRALNAARAACMSRSNHMIIVVSGDGDLVNIGGNALIHTAREKNKFPVLCICLDNANYGMTGGQISATTPAGNKTSMPVEQSPFDLKKLLYDGIGINFFARSFTADVPHLKMIIEKAIDFVRNNKSFAFVQVFSPCTTYSVAYNKKYFSRTNLENYCGIWERSKNEN